MYEPADEIRERSDGMRVVSKKTATMQDGKNNEESIITQDQEYTAYYTSDDDVKRFGVYVVMIDDRDYVHYFTKTYFENNFEILEEE